MVVAPAPVSPPSRPWRALAVLSIAALVSLAVPVFANHVQTVSTGGATYTVEFDHGGDNAWWVEVEARSSNGDSLTGMFAQVEGSATQHYMQFAANDYARQQAGWSKFEPDQSFNVPAGKRVMFHVGMSDGATGQSATVASCWFTHPAGVEQCSTTPSPWQTTPVGDAGLFSWTGDMAVSDVDNDGRRDVTVATSRGLRVYEWTGSAWTTEIISTLDLGGVAAGDGDGDGRNEIYAVQPIPDGTRLWRFEKAPAGWFIEPLASFPETNVGDMTLGSIDGMVGPELYLGLYETWCDPQAPGYCISNSTVHHVFHNGDFWDVDVASELGGHIDSVWIGDGDNNGSSELYVGHGTRHADRTAQVQRYQGQWVTTGLPGYGSDSGMALAVVGDGDRDGRNEVYTANWYGVMWKSSYDAVNGWTQTFLTMESGYSPISLALGDADSDGTQELYMTTSGGDLVQVRWSGTAWAFTKISDPQLADHEGQHAFLVIGDGDGDGQREAYIAAAFLPLQGEGGWDTGATKVYKVAIPRSTGFDAAFTGVRGNEWWEQVSVSATGSALSKVDVRLNGGAWQPMTKQSYGYTASYRAVQGTIVQFKATSTTGATDLSDCYRWIPPTNTDATKVVCGSTTTTTSTTSTTGSAFDATFSGAKGNGWWVQVSVSANQALAGVDARINCSGEWRPLAKQSYGWSASFNVPAGSKVDFRARSTSGATDLSGGYLWPNATPTSAC